MPTQVPDDSITAMAPELSLPDASGAPTPSDSPWARIADFGVLGLWITAVGFTLSHHEKWADEAQAWLIARDLDLKTIWFHELRYEGSTGLWHTILWIAQHIFHAPYAALGVIGMACATAGVAFMLWNAPFPRPLRYMLAFSYFIVYQYAVIARPYVLLPLLAFAAASFFPDRRRPERMTVVLVLLVLLSLHGILLAGGIGLAYLVEAAKSWRELDGAVRRRYVACVCILAAAFVFAFLVLKPTPDVDSFAKSPDPSKIVWLGQPDEHRLWKSARLVSIISGALLDFAVPSAIFLLIAGLWCFTRRRLLAFALPTGLLVLLYVWIHGVSHHHGTVFVSVIAGLWIAWPTGEELRRAKTRDRRATQAMVALLGCVLAVNIWDAGETIRYDYLLPYSGAEDAAGYLKSIGAEKQTVFGYTYGIAAVQAYFDKNLVKNIPTSYFHHGLPSYGSVLDFEEIQSRQPDYLVTLTEDPAHEMPKLDPLLNSYGYQLVHVSDGYLYFKQSVVSRQVYVVYRRTY